MWWFLVRAVVSGIISSSAGQWFLGTKVGIWSQDKINKYLDYLSEKYDLAILKQEEKWRRQYPLLAKRIDKLEEWSHPPVAPGGATELKDEIEELRNIINTMKQGK